MKPISALYFGAVSFFVSGCFDGWFFVVGFLC